MTKLSELITTAKFETKLPVSKQIIQFRPFLVKEQKALLQAQMDESVATAILTIQSVLSSCTFGVANVENMSSTDIEWLMLQIRAKSVGEEINMNLTCPHCGNIQQHSASIADVKVSEQKQSVTNPIMLEPGLYVDVQVPNIKQAMTFEKKDSVEVVASCIKSIIHGDEIISSENVELAELVEFVESMTNKMLTQVVEYIDSAPTLSLSISAKCEKCEKLIETEVKGVMGFLG